jgi:histidinol phosphatase-like enzyme
MSEELFAVDSDSLLDSIHYCPHTPWEHCECRKPMPGMLNQAMNKLRAEKMSLSAWNQKKPTPLHHLDSMIGDRRADMGAGWQVGARLFKVDRDIGLVDVLDRILDIEDGGDEFQP